MKTELAPPPRRRIVVSTVLAAATGLAVLGGGAAPAASQAVQVVSTDWDVVVAEAQKEGKVIFYTSGLDAVATELIAAFQAKHGLAAEYAKLTGPVMTQRVISEARSQNVQADVILHADVPALRTFLDSGMLAELVGPEVAGIDAALTTDKAYTSIEQIALGIVYRADIGKPPARWQDMNDPVHKGKILAYAPEGTPVFAIGYDRIEAEIDPEFINKLATQDVRQFTTFTTAVPLLTGGSVDMAAPVASWTAEAVARSVEGLKTVYPEPVPVYDRYSAVLAGAPNPNAGMLFHNFLLTREAQEIINGNGRDTSPIFDDIETAIKLPPNRIPIYSPDVLEDPLARVEAILSKWAAVVGAAK